jgi:hypothetical protein
MLLFKSENNYSQVYLQTQKEQPITNIKKMSKKTSKQNESQNDWRKLEYLKMIYLYLSLFNFH